MIENTDAKRIVDEAFSRNYEAMSNRREAWKLYYSYYNQMYPDPEEESQYTNNSFDPVLAEKVETYRPFICRRIPDLQFVPRELDADSAISRKHEFFQRYQWYRQGMKQKRQSLAFYAVLLGTAGLFQFYRKDEDEVWSRTFKDGLAVENSERKTIYDDPDCEVIDIMFDFLPDGVGTDIDSCGNIIHIQYFTPERLRNLAKGDQPWITNLPNEVFNYYGASNLETKLNELDRFKDSHSLVGLIKSGIVEVRNYWEDDRLIIQLNREFIARDSKNPFKALRKKKPFALFKFLDDPTQFWGKGLGDILVKTQHVTNVLERLKIDAAKDELRPKMIAPFNSGIDPSPLYNGEKYVIEGPATMNPLQFLPKPDLSTVGLATQADMRNRADSVSGAPPLLSGMSGGGESATESRIMQSNLMQRAFYVLGNIDFGFAKWMLNNVALAVQYYPEKKDLRVMNEQGGLIQGTITYDELLSGVDVEVKANSGQPITADDRTLQADAMLSRFGADPWFKARKIRVAAARMMELPIDPEDLVYTEQEMAQQQAAQYKQAMEKDQADKQHELQMAMARAMFKEGAEEQPAAMPAQVPSGPPAGVRQLSLIHI